MGNGWEMESVFIFFIKVDQWLILFFLRLKIDGKWKCAKTGDFLLLITDYYEILQTQTASQGTSVL